MAIPRQTQRLRDIHAEALAEFDRIYAACSDERRQCLEDRRFAFVPGAQWDGALSRQFAKKPKLEVNKIAVAIRRQGGEFRSNPLSARFISRDGKDAGKLADLCAGKYRADVRDSNGDEACNNAFDEALAGGIGAWRWQAVKRDADDEESTEQVARRVPIYDADTSVFFGDSQRQDKADATSCFITIPMSREAYKREYDDDPQSWSEGGASLLPVTVFEWSTPDLVWIAEVYLVRKTKQWVSYWRAPDGSEVKHTDDELDEDDGAMRAEIEALGFREMRREKREKREVRKYIMSGGKVLEDCGVIAGKRIPVVMVYGERRVINGIERAQGMVRITKDAQRVLNAQTSKLLEISATSVQEKPIMLAEQLVGHQDEWARANIDDLSVLQVNAMRDAEGNIMPSAPIGWTKPASIPQPLAALIASMDGSIKELLGNPTANDATVSNVSSETALLGAQRTDSTSAVYIDNFAMAMRCDGEIWLDIAQDIYVEEGRETKVVSADGKASMVTLNEPGVVDGVVTHTNDLSRARMDVVVEVGPSSASKRQAAVRQYNELLRVPGLDPATAQVIVAMIMTNVEGEGMEDFNAYFRKQLVTAGVIPPTEEEAAEMQKAQQQASQQQDPNAVFLAAEAQKSQALAQKAIADTALSQANAALKAAETQKTEVETLKLTTEIGRAPVANGSSLRPF